jgi:hypothetical protein
VDVALESSYVKSCQPFASVHAIKAHLRPEKEFSDARGLVLSPSDVGHHLWHDNRQGLPRGVRTYHSYQSTITAWLGDKL